MLIVWQISNWITILPTAWCDFKDTSWFVIKYNYISYHNNGEISAKYLPLLLNKCYFETVSVNKGWVFRFALEMGATTRQSTPQSFSQSVSQSISQSIHQSINQSVNQLVNPSVNQSVSQSINPSVNPLVN